MCLLRLAKSLQNLWICEDTTAWNPCVLRAMILRAVEIFRGVVRVCSKLYSPGGRISDCARLLGGVSGFSVYKMSDYYCASSYHSRETRVCCFCLEILLNLTSENGRLFLPNRRRWVASSTPRPHFTPGKDPVPIVQEAGWALGPVWTGAENLATTGIRTPDLPARSQSLYRMS